MSVKTLLNSKEEYEIPKITIVKLHRVISWFLALFSLTTILSGYASSRKWVDNFYVMTTIHKISEWFFLIALIGHIVLTSRFFKINWKKVLKRSQSISTRRLNNLKIAQRVTSWLILVALLVVVLSGFNNYRWFAVTLGQLFIFSFTIHRYADGFLTVLIIIHVVLGVIAVLIRKRALKSKFVIPTIFLSAVLISSVGLIEWYGYKNEIPNYQLPNNAVIKIGANIYSFNPQEVTSIRPDIFKNGSFSVFDILVYLDNASEISLSYHFDSSMNTHVIDSLNGQDKWWYEIYYSGGWSEDNVFRMDLYTWKEGATIELFRYSSDFRLSRIYNAFQEETTRLNNNNGTLIIPEIEIRGKTFHHIFYDVEITSHNLRSDIFQEGVITGIDVIISLEELGLIDSYELQWYDEIGTAKIVRNYWVNGIDGDKAYGTCGFVYEYGDKEFDGFSGNHIHLPSDSRVITSPEYGFWFWICL